MPHGDAGFLAAATDAATEIMMRTTAPFLLALLSACASAPAAGVPCAESSAPPLTVGHASGTFLQPESVRFRPHTVGIPDLFAATSSAYGGTVAQPDTMGWISFFDGRGRQWTPAGGFGGESGFSADPSWQAQCGAGLLHTPLGIAVGVSGRLYVVDGFKVDGDPSVEIFDMEAAPDGGGNCVYAGAIRMHGLKNPNDVGVGPSGELYVTDSAFGAAGKSAIYRVTSPDSAPHMEKWLDLSAHPAPNPLAIATIDIGNGPRPYLFVATLGTLLDPTAADGFDGEILRVEVLADGSPGPVTVLGADRGMYDGIAVRQTADGPRLLVSDLRTRVIDDVDPATGDYAPWVDLSGQAPQLGGVGCNDSASASVCASAEYRGSGMYLLRPETAYDKERREAAAKANCVPAVDDTPATKPPGTEPPSEGGVVVPPVTTPGSGSPGGDHT